MVRPRVFLSEILDPSTHVAGTCACSVELLRHVYAMTCMSKPEVTLCDKSLKAHEIRVFPMLVSFVLFSVSTKSRSEGGAHPADPVPLSLSLGIMLGSWACFFVACARASFASLAKTTTRSPPSSSSSSAFFRSSRDNWEAFRQKIDTTREQSAKEPPQASSSGRTSLRGWRTP